MINFYIGIKNPIWKNGDNDKFKMIWQFVKLFGHKELDVRFYRHVWYWFQFGINTTWYGEDHAGPELSIGVFGYVFEITLADNRHWDDEAGSWESY
jgi:hypothetical protein